MFRDHLQVGNLDTLKKLPNLGTHYSVIPTNFVKIYGFKNITGTSDSFFVELR
jgi:hypothetical protein